MKTQVSHNLIRHGYRSLMRALSASQGRDSVIRLRVNKNIIGKPFTVDHDLTIVGNGLKKTVIYLADSITMLSLMAGNVKFKNLTVILSAYSCLYKASPDYRGHVEFDHVRVYHDSGLSRREIRPDIEMLGNNDVMPATIDAFDCQFDCIYVGVKHFEFTHCSIGDLWSKSGLIGAPKGLILKSVASNSRIEAVHNGEIDLKHDTVHGLLSFGGHIKLRNLIMQAPKAPTGWIIRRRLHKQNRVYHLPKAVNFLMADNVSFLIQGYQLPTLIDCKGIQEDGDSFRIWRKNAHLELNPRWIAFKNVAALLSGYNLQSHLPNQFVNCKLNGKISKQHTKDRPLVLNHEAIRKAHKPKPKPLAHRHWHNAVTVKGMLKQLVKLMKTNRIFSSGPSASQAMVKGLKKIHQMSSGYDYAAVYLRYCTDHIVMRTRNESEDAQQRDRNTITPDDANWATHQILLGKARTMQNS